MALPPARSEGGVVKFVNVQTGIQDGAGVEIVNGLKDGDEVVAKAGAYVRDGDHITPVKEAPKASQLSENGKMNFSAWSIRNPVAPLLAFFLLMVVGAHVLLQSADHPFSQYRRAGRRNVTVTQSGASPAELEMRVTKEVEDAVAGINGIDEIQSTVTDGQFADRCHLPFGGADGAGRSGYEGRDRPHPRQSAVDHR